LTEDNLKRLDDRINKESDLRDKKEGILDDRKSEKSAGPRARSQRPGTTGSQRGAALQDDKNETRS
jgi:hypothetical protein